jgi:hypothetical protein
MAFESADEAVEILRRAAIDDVDVEREPGGPVHGAP